MGKAWKWTGRKGMRARNSFKEQKDLMELEYLKDNYIASNFLKVLNLMKEKLKDMRRVEEILNDIESETYYIKERAKSEWYRWIELNRIKDKAEYYLESKRIANQIQRENQKPLKKFNWEVAKFIGWYPSQEKEVGEEK